MMKRLGANRRGMRDGARKGTHTIMRKVFSRICVLAATAAVIYAGYGAAKKVSTIADNAEWLKVGSVAVKGVVHVDTAEVLSRAGIRTGISMTQVKVSEIRKNILKNPWIKKVHVHRSLSNTVRIEIVEREPIALINLKDIFYADNEGYLWPLRTDAYWNIPVVSGLKDTVVGKEKLHRLREGDRVKMMTFFNQVHRHRKEANLGISQIDFREGGIVYMRLESSPVTVLLQSERVARNLIDLHEIFSIAQGDTGTISEYINLAYANMAFVR